jgi:hypothetical protein
VKAGINLDGIFGRLPRLRLARPEKQCHLCAKSGTNLDGIFRKVAAPAPGEAAPREVLATGVASGEAQESVPSICESWN